MNISLRSIRGAAAGTVGAAAVAGAMLFGGTATAQAAPAPAIGSSFAEVGPGIAPTWGGHGFGGHGFGGHGGFGRGGGFGHGGFGRGFGGWGHGGWGRGGFGHGFGGWGHGFGGWGHRGFFPWF